MFTDEERKKLKQEEIFKRSQHVVKKLFSGKCDKASVNYMDHLYHVSRDFKSNRQKAMALMHDVLEDTTITKEELFELGYDKKFVEVLEILTNTYPTYEEYIEKILESNNKTAIEIKIKDLLHNMDLTRLKVITKKDLTRAKKYMNAYIKLIEKMESECK